MDPKLKNLREWVMLLLALFVVLDIAGVQYGMQLAGSASSEPNELTGEIVTLIQGSHGANYHVYVTPQELWVCYGLLGGAGLALLSMLSLIVVHGMRRVRIDRREAMRQSRWRR